MRVHPRLFWKLLCPLNFINIRITCRGICFVAFFSYGVKDYARMVCKLLIVCKWMSVLQIRLVEGGKKSTCTFCTKNAACVEYFQKIIVWTWWVTMNGEYLRSENYYKVDWLKILLSLRKGMFFIPIYTFLEPCWDREPPCS